jgi:BirA family biotin operon repressor/biotin-[acetyl-CoA-carboxylase] ligase
MDLLHHLAEQGAVAGTTVVAAEQTAGRGSRGRGWHSPRGGLWLSMLLRPARTGVELLSLRAGLAIAQSLDRLGPGIGLKWPNDLMWGERKLGGVLCEARWAAAAVCWVSVGVGLNVRNPIAPELAGKAAALIELNGEATVDGVLALVLPGLRSLEMVRPRLTPEEQAQLTARDWLRGRALAGPIEGRADGIASDGSLHIVRPDGSSAALRAGSVVLADRPAPS